MNLDLLCLGTVLSPGGGLSVEKICFPVFHIFWDVTCCAFKSFQDAVLIARWKDLHVWGCVHEDLESFPGAFNFGVSA